MYYPEVVPLQTKTGQVPLSWGEILKDILGSRNWQVILMGFMSCTIFCIKYRRDYPHSIQGFFSTFFFSAVEKHFFSFFFFLPAANTSLLRNLAAEPNCYIMFSIIPMILQGSKNEKFITAKGIFSPLWADMSWNTFKWNFKHYYFSRQLSLF